jgi:hypothetical protein
MLASSVEQNSAGRFETRSSLAGCSSISAVPNEAEWTAGLTLRQCKHLCLNARSCQKLAILRNKISQLCGEIEWHFFLLIACVCHA